MNSHLTVQRKQSAYFDIYYISLTTTQQQLGSSSKYLRAIRWLNRCVDKNCLVYSIAKSFFSDSLGEPKGAPQPITAELYEFKTMQHNLNFCTRILRLAEGSARLRRRLDNRWLRGDALRAIGSYANGRVKCRNCGHEANASESGFQCGQCQRLLTLPDQVVIE